METHEARRANLAAVIRAELAVQQKSKHDLAVAVGFSEDTLRRRLDGLKPFYVNELEAAGAFLGFTLTELIQKSEAR